jgi:hypothetical protein
MRQEIQQNYFVESWRYRHSESFPKPDQKEVSINKPLPFLLTNKKQGFEFKSLLQNCNLSISSLN